MPNIWLGGWYTDESGGIVALVATALIVGPLYCSGCVIIETVLHAWIEAGGMFIADNESDVITRLLGTAPWLPYRSSPGAENGTDGTELYDTTFGGIVDDTDGTADIGIEAI